MHYFPVINPSILKGVVEVMSTVRCLRENIHSSLFLASRRKNKQENGNEASITMEVYANFSEIPI